MDLETIISETDNKEFFDFLAAQLREYNNRVSPPHLQSRQPGAVTPLHIQIKDPGGALLGGLTASTYWGWLEIEKFYLPTDLRGSGLGSRILTQAEDIALQRGCRHSFLTTFEFQARQFYEKRGYHVVGQLDDFPPGSAYYWMTKPLGS